MTPSCLTCRNWLPRETDKAWPALGYARCRNEKAWTVLSLAATCPKHEPCSEDVAEKRRKWAQRFRAEERCATERGRA